MITSEDFLRVIRSISVEPVLLLNSLAVGLHGVIYRYGLYHAICEQLTGEDCVEAGANTTHNGTSKAVENMVQKATADFTTYAALAYMIPAVFVDIVLGALGDRYGRKINILLGLLGTVIFIIPTIFLYKYPHQTPLYVLVIANVIGGLTGFMSIVLISSFAYLADTVVNQEMLTIRMAILQVTINIGQMLGPLIGSTISTLMERSYQELVTLSILVLAITLGMVMLRQMPPSEMKARMAKMAEDKKLSKGEEEPPAFELSVPKGNDSIKKKISLIIPADINEKAEEAASKTQSPRKSIACRIFTETIQLLKDVWATYTKPREGHTRAYLGIISFVFFAAFTAEGGLRWGMLALYVQKAPLKWNQAMLGYYDAAHGAAITLGTLLGTVVLKKCLHLSDAMLIMIALISAAAEMLVIAFANQTWLLFLSVALGCMANAVKPCSKSFVAKLVHPDEVGKAYTVFGIAQTIALMLSRIFYNILYTATLELWPGLSFAFAAGVFLITFFVVLGVYLDSKRQSQLH